MGSGTSPKLLATLYLSDLLENIVNIVDGSSLRKATLDSLDTVH